MLPERSLGRRKVSFVSLIYCPKRFLTQLCPPFPFSVSSTKKAEGIAASIKDSVENDKTFCTVDPKEKIYAQQCAILKPILEHVLCDMSKLKTLDELCDKLQVRTKYVVGLGSILRQAFVLPTNETRYLILLSFLL